MKEEKRKKKKVMAKLLQRLAETDKDINEKVYSGDRQRTEGRRERKGK